MAWKSSPSLPGGCALTAASTELDDRPGPARDYLSYHHASRLAHDPDASERVLRTFESLVRVARATGGVTFVVDPAEKHYDSIGMVHGGAAATLLDPVMRCAVHTLFSAGGGCTTLDLDIRYVKRITVATGTIVASGTVLHHGRCTATAEGCLGAADTGALLADGPSTLLVLS